MHILVSNDHDSGAGSLRAAIEMANADAAADVITFAADLAGRTITLAAGELAITQALRIDGDLDDDGVADLTISGGGASRIFDIAATAPTEIEGLVLTNGRATGSGGAVRAHADLTVLNSVIVDNVVTGVGKLSGGAIAGTSVLISGSTIERNRISGSGSYYAYAYADGGGVAAESITVRDSIVAANSAGGSYTHSRGGGLFASDGLEIFRSVITKNGVGGELAVGGGVFGGNVAVIDSEISSNGAFTSYYGNAAGGGVRADVLYIENSIVLANRVRGPGGGISANTVTGRDTDFIDNQATDGGGGGLSAGAVRLVGGAVSGNSSNALGGAGGGGINGAVVDLDGVLVSSNEANYNGGGVFATTLSATKTVFSGNKSRGCGCSYEYDASGAGAFVRNLTLTESLVVGNIASGGDNFRMDGGGMFAYNATVVDSSFVDNSILNAASASGGGLYAKSGEVTNSTFVGNSIFGYSQLKGGGLFIGTGSIDSTTVTGNSIADASAPTALVLLGGGIAGGASLSNSIVLGNSATFGIGTEASEIDGLSPDRAFGRNLIGSSTEIFDGTDYLSVENADAALVFAETVETNGIVSGIAAENGGLTPTVALRPTGDNPAIDRAIGVPEFPLPGTDQRGFARVDFVPGGIIEDIGAFEADAQPLGRTLVVRAAGEGGPGGDLAPRFSLRINGTEIKEVAILRPFSKVERNNDYYFDDYVFEFIEQKITTVEITFLNDGGGGLCGVNRNLFIDWIEVDGMRSETELSAVNTVFDPDGDRVFFDREGMFREGLMTWEFTD